ncbi:phosphopantothenoylcysteine synthetase/decarboxylase [Saccharomonospora marina XMU15]|uniref:Flavoprotein n=2 Tax=Pseudonocardiaceae TaxID=2070 RepID=A0A2N3X158_9PSEU|nr:MULTISPECIES: flavoprotein [Pseudonocardiaceae]EHR48404.1 phosphopantothenoylcysteine synthetase/decarboxylase [Saccharomonospora marina XMU15]PKV99851.1 flavoprotein [Amycolatopsis niigatensis]
MNVDPRWIYLVTSAAPPVLRLEDFIPALYADGWAVCVIATPTAATWIDLDALAATTGCLTRVHPRPPRQQEESLPRAEAVLVAPVTFNSINKWASGTSDTLALGVLNEMLGAGVPIIAAPCVKPVLRQHPAYADSIARLANAGVVLLDPDAITRRAEDGLATFDWSQIIAALRDTTGSVVDR